MAIQEPRPILAEQTSARSRNGVLYARVSSKEQESGFSILAQEQLLAAYALQLNLKVERFSDVETAQTVGRPGFNALVAYLRTPPDCPHETTSATRLL